MRRALRVGSCLAVLACAGATAGLAPGAMYDQLPVFTEALNTIYQSYVDELPAGKLFDSAIVGASRLGRDGLLEVAQLWCQCLLV